VLLALAVGLPFLNKPFTIDDPVVLAVSAQVLQDPLRPFSGRINWAGDPVPLFRQTTNPPLLSYYLAPFIAAFGYSEVALHASMLLFLVMLALASAELSRRFADGSWWPVLFVLTSPAVVVSGNVMRDVPVTALAAAAVAVFVRGTDEDRPWLLVAGSLLAGCAMLTKYSAAIVFPLLALYPLLHGRVRPLWALLPGTGLVGLWCAQNLWSHGVTHLQYLMAASRTQFVWQDHFCGGMAVVGACCFLAPAVALGTAASRSWWRVPVYAAAVPLVARGLSSHFQEPSPDWQYLLWSESGGVLLWTLAAAFVLLGVRYLWLVARPAGDPASEVAKQWRDELFLVAWLFVVVYFSVVYVMFQAVRHLLPAMVPLCLLGCRLLQRVDRPVRLVSSGALTLCLAAQVIVSSWVASADYEYADTYRQFARTMPQALPATNGKVWFAGNWGWQHYAQRAGWRLMATNGPQPDAGDLVIIPDRVHKGPMPPGLYPRLEEVSEHTYRTRLRMFTMNGFDGASFYAVTDRNLPYLYSRDDTLEVFRVYRAGPRPTPTGEEA
jgi:hypothetical protein